MRSITIILAMAAAGWLGSCAENTYPVGPKTELTPEQKNFEAVWQASLQTLRGYEFEIDRQDRRAGVITTLPMVGRQWFECWRRDAATPADAIESSTQTIYRRATVTVRRSKPDADTFVAEVSIDVERSDRARPQISNTSEFMDMFVLQGSPRTIDESNLLAAKVGEDTEEQTATPTSAPAEATAATGPATNPADASTAGAAEALTVKTYKRVPLPNDVNLAAQIAREINNAAQRPIDKTRGQ